MRIAVDSNVPYAAEAFAGLGEIEVFRGNALSPKLLHDCEALIVRSTTRVDAGLLDGTPVRFVGTATSGTEHVDQTYLRESGITFVDAAGSNATSVAEYLTLSLHLLAKDRNFNLSETTLGLIGCGHVGREVLRCAKALGMECFLCDPPLARATAEPAYRDLHDVLQCDIVTLHVPLTDEGPDPTRRLIDGNALAQMKPGSILINAARGGVVDEAALREALDTNHLDAAILDVWENEPDFDPATVERGYLATPHIAGHSLDAKARGTEMMAKALADFFGSPTHWKAETALKQEKSVVPSQIQSLDAALDYCLDTLYDPRADDALMRDWAMLDATARAQMFNHYRRNYPVRREFSSLQVTAANPGLARRLSLLGLHVVDAVS